MTISEEIIKRILSVFLTVVDYGCGPGRYSRLFSEKVGDSGKVYAVDVHKEAIKDIELPCYALCRIERKHLKRGK